MTHRTFSPAVRSPGMAAAHARCEAILGEPLALKHPKTAAILAFRSRLSVAEARDVLASIDSPQAAASARRHAAGKGAPLCFADVLGVSAPIVQQPAALSAREIIAAAERLGVARR